MQAQCLNSLFKLKFALALILIGASAYAQSLGPGGGFVMAGGGRPPPSLTRGTCSHDSVGATTYNNANFQALGTGAVDGDSVVVVIGVTVEDSATNFSCSSMTIDGNAATEIVDQGGTNQMNSCLYRTSGEVTGANQVNVSVTMSEATSNATVCGWALKGLAVTNAVDSSVADDDANAGALVLTLGTTNGSGLAIGICGDTATSVTTTWAVLTEREDVQGTGSAYSNADGSTTGSSMSVTCDWSGTNNTAGSAAAFH